MQRGVKMARKRDWVDGIAIAASILGLIALVLLILNIIKL